MRIIVAGAGPAGLYFAYLMKASWPAWRIAVIEQNAPGDTFGFGVVLSGRALSFLSDADPRVVERLTRRMESWSDQHIVVQGRRIVIDGSAYSGISRLVLLDELRQLCAAIGVEIAYGRRLADASLADECDVLVGADGANSIVRDCFQAEFGTEIVDLRNHFAWYGVERAYPAHTLTFLTHERGVFCGHHYRYTPDMSTFVAETDAVSWRASGFDCMTDDERRRATQDIFHDVLGGQPLIDNRSLWRRYRIIKNRRWHHANIALVGDALRTAHPSIGSGTRLAIEDSIALWRAFAAGGTDIESVFKTYQTAREPVRDKLNRAAERSIAWYEDMAAKMKLHPLDFAWDYLMRTGVMTPERLQKECPAFMALYRSHNARDGRTDRND